MTTAIVLKDVADATVITGVLTAWLTHLPDVAAAFAIVYTVVRLIIEGPRLVAAIRNWFK